MVEVFVQLSIIILVVLGVSLIMRILKQPLIVGYILSGIIAGPFIFDLIQDSKTILTFSQMGVAFLLFIVGLHLSPKVLKQVGKISVITGLGQIIFTVGLGYFITLALGFDKMTSLYIAIAITFSSTIIVMKLLSDKDDLEKLYGKVAMGLALVQTIVAIFILIIISSLGTGQSFGISLISTSLKGVVLLLVLIPFSYIIFPRISNFLAKSSEFLFLFSIAWGFGISVLFLQMGFSIEIGALVAGILLSVSPYSYEMSSKLKPLRDFFILSFFVLLGSQMVFSEVSIRMVLILSTFILIGNPFIVIVLMGIMGYSKKTGFMSGLTVAQISEFSLIFVTLLISTQQLASEILSSITVIALITMAGSTYMIIYSDSIYERFKKGLRFFERKKIKERETPRKEYDYILLGYNRIGFSILKSFSEIKKNFLIIDHDPKIIKDLKKRGFDAVYGDVEDADFLESFEIAKSKLIVSTIPEVDVNHLILNVLKINKSEAITLLTARQIFDAVELYESGADYVITPHFLGGEYVSRMIKDFKTNKEKYKEERNKHKKLLKEMKEKGKEHPRIEKG